MKWLWLLVPFYVYGMSFEAWKAHRHTEAYQKEQQHIADKKARASQFAQGRNTQRPSSQFTATPLPSEGITQRFHTQDARYIFEINGHHATIPYAANLDFSQPHPEVQRLVIAIHSSSYNADTYLETMLMLLQRHTNMAKRVAVFAPLFQHSKRVTQPNTLTWDVTPFRGSSKARYRHAAISLSTYDILDHFLTDIITSNRFPHLQHIVILGHSAGGQMVNRYAASSPFEHRVANPNNISVSYLVMAPSSYVYFDNTRALQGANGPFSTPTQPHARFNQWGYGLKNLYKYHKRHRITATDIRNAYARKKILYLVGRRDAKTDATLGRSKSAMLQGRHRKERAIIYYRHLQHHFGPHITQHQKLAIIPRVGHWGRGLMLSQEGERFILFEK